MLVGNEEFIAAVRKGLKCGRKWKGCCINDTGSSPMLQHVVSMAIAFRDGKKGVPEHILPPDQVWRMKAKRKKMQDAMGPDGTPKVEPDKDIVRDAALCHCILDLQPLRCFERNGAKRFMGKYLPKGEVNRDSMQKAVPVDEIHRDIYAQVVNVIKEAKRKGAKFAIQADAWKPKFRRARRKYSVTICSWVDPSTNKLREIVIGVGELKMGGHKAYYEEIKASMENVGLVPDDIMAFVTDHDGAVRKGMAMFDRPLLGCGCHALQLPIGHVLPLLRKKKVVKEGKLADKEDDDDDDDDVVTDAGYDAFSDLDSEGPDSEWEDVADGAEGAEEHQVERLRLRKHITAIVKKARAIVKWYDRQYQILVDIIDRAKENPKSKLMSFMSETPTRWSSAYSSWVRVLRNH